MKREFVLKKQDQVLERTFSIMSLRSVRSFQSQLTIWLFLLPALLPLSLFWIWPMFYSIYISFTDWDYISPVYEFVGLSNYTDLLTDPSFYQVLLNTLYFSIGTVIPTMVFGLFLALLLKSKLLGIGIYRTILFSPWITPTVAISIVWSWIFEPRVGMANWLLDLLSLPKLEWASSTTWAMPVIIIVSIWKGVGWAVIFYLEALHRVPQELYESAEMDGASGWKKFTSVTLPMISPTSFFLCMVLTIDALQAYDQIQILTQGGPAGSTRTILYYYYQAAFEQFNMGQATAVSTILLLITGFLAFIQFMMSKRWVHYQ